VYGFWAVEVIADLADGKVARGGCVFVSLFGHVNQYRHAWISIVTRETISSRVNQYRHTWISIVTHESVSSHVNQYRHAWISIVTRGTILSQPNADSGQSYTFHNTPRGISPRMWTKIAEIKGFSLRSQFVQYPTTDLPKFYWTILPIIQYNLCIMRTTTNDNNPLLDVINRVKWSLCTQ
jgi:hypothetical protein